VLVAARLFSWATAAMLAATVAVQAGDRVYPTVDLVEVVRNRGALLVFYRGGW
jgi:hypothetical protein